MDRQAAANHWAHAMRLPIEPFFQGREHLIPTNTPDSVVMSPGYAGRNYDEGGCLFVGNSPAGGGPGYVRNAVDARFYGVLREGMEVDGARATLLWFERMAEAWIDAQRHWPLYKIVIAPALGRCGLDANAISFLNLFPFRLSQNILYASMLDAAWDRVVARQIEILRPGRVVLLGAKTRGLWERKQLPIPFNTLERQIGDRALTAEAAEEIERLRDLARVELPHLAEDSDPGSSSSPAIQLSR